MHRNAGNPRSRALTDTDHIGVPPPPPPPPPRRPLIQDLAYHHHWPTTTDDAQTCLPTNHQSTHHHHHHHFSKIKEDISDTNFPTISTDILNISPSNMEPYELPPTSHMMKNNEHKQDMTALNDKLLLKTLFSGDLYSTTNPQNYHNFGAAPGVPSRGNFSQIYPSVNVSNLNHSSSSSFHMTMTTHSLDLLTSPASFTTSAFTHHPSQHLPADTHSFRLHHMHAHHSSSASSSTNSTTLSVSISIFYSFFTFIFKIKYIFYV